MRNALCFSVLILLSGLTDAADGLSAAKVMASPAAADSAEPHLAQGPDGTVVLSWLEHSDEETTLRYSVLAGDRWQPAKTVSRGDNWFVNWADFPSVSPITPKLWAAHWLAKRPGGAYAYDVVIALSKDGGESWGKPFTPHSDNTATEHGFVSLFPWRDGVGALWLDGRKMAEDGAADAHDSGSHGSGGGMTLRAALISPDSAVTDEFLVDDLVCDCCQTDVAIGPQGPIAVYRNRTAGEIRDIYVSRVINNLWQAGHGVSDDGWEIAGCPVNGPAIAASGTDVAVAWFTMAGDVSRVRFTRSGFDAAAFSDAIDIDEGTAVGRVDMAILEDGRAVVSWLRNGEDQQGQIAIRVVSETGNPGPIQIIAPTSTARPAGFPQMVSSGEKLVFAWTDTSGDVPIVQTARVEIASLAD